MKTYEEVLEKLSRAELRSIRWGFRHILQFATLSSPPGSPEREARSRLPRLHGGS